MKLLLFLLVIPFSVLAHPGIGIVKDRQGNIYYTDLEQVWKLDKSGNKKIVVHNVHTNELYMDGEDNLYGEHSWYNGERLNTSRQEVFLIMKAICGCLKILLQIM